jgi:hypothetical protein
MPPLVPCFPIQLHACRPCAAPTPSRHRARAGARAAGGCGGARGGRAAARRAAPAAPPPPRAAPPPQGCHRLHVPCWHTTVADRQCALMQHQPRAAMAPLAPPGPSSAANTALALAAPLPALQPTAGRHLSSNLAPCPCAACVTRRCASSPSWRQRAVPAPRGCCPPPRCCAQEVARGCC